MAHGDGAAVDVELVVRDLEQLHVEHDDGGEGLVELVEIDVARLHAGAGQYLARDLLRPRQHDRGLGADGREGADARARLQARLLARFLGADQDGGGAVDDARRITRVVHVVDALDFRIAHVDDRIEARFLAEPGEGGIEARERLHRRLGAHVLVVIEEGQADLVLHGDDRLLEAAFLPGLRGALLALDGEAIDVGAGEAPLGGDHVGSDALRGEVALEGHGRIGRPGAAVGAHGHAAHALDAAADGKVGLAGHDLGRGHVGRFEARGAEAVDLHASDRLGIVRIENGQPRDVGALLLHRRDAAQHDVVDERGIEVVAVADGLQDGRRQMQRRHLVQGTVALAATARRADGVVDVGLSHFLSPLSRRGSSARVCP